MKKIIFAMCLFMASGFAGVIAQKVGHVDFQSIMISLPERKSAEDTLKKFAASIQNDMRIMEARYQERVAQYDRDKKAGASADVLAVAEQDIMEYQQRIMNFEEKAQERMQMKESELLKPMIDKVKAAVAKVAKAQGVGYVFDISQLIYMEGGIDLTALVRKELGLPAAATTGGGN